ncbi:MAG: hypothetical protein ACRDYB_03150 [Acidimicrobiales bacterium]
MTGPLDLWAWQVGGPTVPFARWRKGRMETRLDRGGPPAPFRSLQLRHLDKPWRRGRRA